MSDEQEDKIPPKRRFFGLGAPTGAALEVALGKIPFGVAVGVALRAAMDERSGR